MFITDPDPGSGSSFLHIPDPGSRGQKGTGSRILITVIIYPERGREGGGGNDQRETIPVIPERRSISIINIDIIVNALILIVPLRLVGQVGAASHLHARRRCARRHKRLDAHEEDEIEDEHGEDPEDENDDDLDAALWNRNYFFRFRFRLLKSFGSGSYF
jgi:hypothetical protein